MDSENNREKENGVARAASGRLQIQKEPLPKRGNRNVAKFTARSRGDQRDSVKASNEIPIAKDV